MKIKIFAIVKDEVDLIEDWLNWYINLFGKENIYVIDNGSTDGTYEILQSYQINLKQDFEKNNYEQINRNNIFEYKDTCDLVIPVDVDEFIVLYQNFEIITDSQKIIEAFKSLPEEYDMFKFHWIEAILCQYEYKDWIELSKFKVIPSAKFLHDAKTFFRSKELLEIRGIAHGGITRSNKIYYGDLALCHFPFRGYKQFKKKKLRGYNLAVAAQTEFMKSQNRFFSFTEEEFELFFKRKILNNDHYFYDVDRRECNIVMSNSIAQKILLLRKKK